MKLKCRVKTDDPTPSDVCRVLRDEVRTCLIVCCASECGWGGEFREGSRLILDRFEECWRRTKSLHTALTTAAEAFRDFTRHSDDGAGPPHASVVSAVVGRGHVYCAWMGGCEAYLVQDGQCLSASLPDTWPTALAQPCEQNNFQPIVGTDIPNAISANICPDYYPILRTARWELPPGGLVILADHQFPQGYDVAELLAVLSGEACDRQRYCIVSCQS